MKYICKICGYIYDDTKEKTPFKDLPDDWACPMCGAPKSLFEPLQEQEATTVQEEESMDNIEKLPNDIISAICSNLAKACEKQYKFEEMELYQQLANYFKNKVAEDKTANIDKLIDLCKEDINDGFKKVDILSKDAQDRGALRAKTWSEKVTFMLTNILERYKIEGNKMLENLNIWVCTVCGFVYIGKELPEICPVCKVPNFKFEKIGGRI